MLFVLLALLFGAAPKEQSWSILTSGLDTNLRGLSAAYFSDAAGVPSPVIWASGSNGVILRSTDLGKTFKRLHVPGGEALDFRGIRAFDANTAYVMSIGEAGKSRIYKTADGGQNWTLQYADKRPAFFLDALVCLSVEECFALSDPVDGKFLLLHTTDGEHWNELPRDAMPAALTNEGAFAASGTSLAVRGKEIYFATGGPAARVFHSPDLGRTWTVAETPIVSGNASSGIFSIVCAKDAVVVVGGDYKDPTRSVRTAAYSLDHGSTWHLASNEPSGFRSAVASLDGAFLVAVGPNGEDISSDQGVHWQHSASLNLNAIFALDERNVWAAGPNGTIARFDRLYEIRYHQTQTPARPRFTASSRSGPHREYLDTRDRTLLTRPRCEEAPAHEVEIESLDRRRRSCGSSFLCVCVSGHHTGAKRRAQAHCNG
jgi:photosystem II stability/assembly factor-like uncharacterized protein